MPVDSTLLNLLNFIDELKGMLLQAQDMLRKKDEELDVLKKEKEKEGK